MTDESSSQPDKKQEIKKKTADTQQTTPLQNTQAFYGIPVKVSAVLGSTQIPVHDFLNLNQGSLITLDRQQGEGVDVYVNDQPVARGELVKVGDHLGIKLTDILHRPVIKESA